MNFALICSPRTGSTAFGNYFRDLGVFVYHEPFRQAKGVLQIEEELKYIYEERGATAIKHVITHLSYAGNMKVIKWLFEKEIPIVFLRRRERVLAAISLNLARQSHVWEVNRRNEQDRLEYDSFQFNPINPHDIYADVGRLHLLEDKLFELIKMSPNVFHTTYENFFNRPLNEIWENMQLLLQFVDVDVPYAEAVLGDHFSEDLKHNQDYEKIPNWDELKEKFGL